MRDFNAGAPDEVCVWMFMRKAPASPALPSELHGRPVAVIAVCYAGDGESGERLLKPLRQFGRPLIDLVKLRPYPDWQKALDPAWGNGFRNQWVGHYLPELTDAAAGTMLDYVSKVPSPFTDVKLAQLGGEVARVGENDTAFGNRDLRYAFVIQTRWKKPEEDLRQLAWTQAIFRRDEALQHGKGLRQLRRRRRRGTHRGCIQRTLFRALASNQGEVRSGEPIQDEPEYSSCACVEAIFDASQFLGDCAMHWP